ncbi:hypothetical protein FSP39_008765 [Pinctada imbricata]|uniref:Uncharacterized protein n=1 Tax=Pinctada imbricata TaxID=66713 RepID=A0AA88XLP2_PINIB|nr:hypothetical protein FSP39_008765 [Pinctada imbricata]
MTQDDIHLVATKQAKVSLDSLVLKNVNDMKTTKIKVSIMERCQREPLRAKLMKVVGTTNSLRWKTEDLKPFRVRSDLGTTLVIRFAKRKSWNCCVDSDKCLCKEKENFSRKFIEQPRYAQGGHFVLERPLTGSLTGVVCEMGGTLSIPEPRDAILLLHQGRFEEANMPSHIEEMWGPIHLPSHYAENKCQIASHRLVNHTQNVQFTTRVIHSLNLMTSVIHVFFHDKLAAVAQVIGLDQLPLTSQVKSVYKTITLYPGIGERAILVKGKSGDAFLLIGKWSGFRKGVPGVPGTAAKRGKKGVPGDPGHLEVNVYSLPATATDIENCQTIYVGASTTGFIFDSMNVDLMTGSITIKNLNKIPELIALAFSVTLLHVLCVPRPSKWRPGETLKPQNTARGDKAMKVVPSEDMSLVMACGLMVDTPSNQYLKHTYGNYVCAGCGSGGETFETGYVGTTIV